MCVCECLCSDLKFVFARVCTFACVCVRSNRARDLYVYLCVCLWFVCILRLPRCFLVSSCVCLCVFVVYMCVL